MTKLRLYDGEEVVKKGTTLKLSARTLQEETVREACSASPPALS